MSRVRSTLPIRKERSLKRVPASLASPSPPTGLRARGRRGEALSSARDRQRLRERKTAERERVEGMIASAPLWIERRAHRRESVVPEHTSSSAPLELGALQPAGCPVCGDERIVTDEVMHGGTLCVLECLHCEHRWTQRPQGRWVQLGARMSRAGRPRALQAGEPHCWRPHRCSSGPQTTKQAALLV